MNDQAINTVLAITGNTGTYGGSATVVIGGWWLSSEAAFLVGMIGVVAGLLVKWVYEHRVAKAKIKLYEAQNLREQQEHDLKMIERHTSAMMSRGGN